MATCWWISYHFSFVVSKLNPQMPQMMSEILYKILISEASQVGEMGGSEYLQGPMNLNWNGSTANSLPKCSSGAVNSLQVRCSSQRLCSSCWGPCNFGLVAKLTWGCQLFRTSIIIPVGCVCDTYRECFLPINKHMFWMVDEATNNQLVMYWFLLVFLGWTTESLPCSFSKEIPLDFKSTQSPGAAKLQILCESSGGFSGGEFDSEPTCLDRTLTKSQPSGLARWSFVRLGRGVSVNVVKGRYPWSSSYSCISMYPKKYSHICM